MTGDHGTGQRRTEAPLSWLTEDPEVYPRNNVSAVHVDDLVHALNAGATLPDPVADAATGILVDGFHRTRALRRFLDDDDAVIGVQVRDFPDKAAMLIASARLNSAHGLSLSRYDQKLVIVKARQVGIADADIAGALNMPVERLIRISVLVAEDSGGIAVPLKNGTAHLAGHRLSDEQISALRRARGGSARSKADDLARTLQTGIAPVSHDPALRLALAELRKEIDAALAPFGDL